MQSSRWPRVSNHMPMQVVPEKLPFESILITFEMKEKMFWSLLSVFLHCITNFMICQYLSLICLFSDNNGGWPQDEFVSLFCFNRFHLNILKAASCGIFKHLCIICMTVTTFPISSAGAFVGDILMLLVLSMVLPLPCDDSALLRRIQPTFSFIELGHQYIFLLAKHSLSNQRYVAHIEPQ